MYTYDEARKMLFVNKLKKSIVLILGLLVMAPTAWGHWPVYLKNNSGTPLLSPEHLVIKPGKTNIWRVAKSLQGCVDAVIPKPWRHVKGCHVHWPCQHPPKGWAGFITVHQKGRSLQCHGSYAPVKIIKVMKKKKAKCPCGPKIKVKKAPVPPKPCIEQPYQLQNVQPLPSQVSEVMVYAIPEREGTRTYYPRSMARQETEIVIPKEDPTRPYFQYQSVQ